LARGAKENPKVREIRKGGDNNGDGQRQRCGGEGERLTIAVGVKRMPKEISEDCQLPCCPGAGLVCICIEI